MDSETIAEREVECIFPHGRREILRLWIGRPYPAADTDWCCRVAADGLYSPPGPIHGIDSWQALILAQRFLESLIQREVERGAVLHWPPGDIRIIEVAELFSCGAPDA